MKTKKIILTALILFISIISTKAQVSIYVEETNGTITQTPLNEVRKIDFSGVDMLLHKTDETVLIWAISDIKKYYYDITTSIKELKNNIEECILYPNPSNGNFKINYRVKNKSNILITVINIYGSIVFQTTKNNLNKGDYIFTINNNLETGSYFVKIQNGNNLITKKIIIIK